MQRTSRVGRPFRRNSVPSVLMLGAQGDGSTLDIDLTGNIPATFTFSRSSVATYNYLGYLYWAPTNQCAASQGPTVPSGGGASGWSAPLNSVSLTTDQNGVADRGRRCAITQTGSVQVTTPIAYRMYAACGSFWLRAPTGNGRVDVGFYDATSGWGASTGQGYCEYLSGYGTTIDIQPSGNPNLYTITGLSQTEWTQFRIRRVVGAVSSLNFYPGGVSAVGGTQTMDIASVQTNPGYFLQPLTETSGAVYNGPRFASYNILPLGTGYAPGQDGLVLEPNRDNWALNSITAIAGTGVTISTPVAISSPEGQGAFNATRVTKSDTTTPRYVSNTTPAAFVTAASTTYTVSRFFRGDGSATTVSLEYNNSADWGTAWAAVFDVTAGGVISVLSQSNCTARVEQWENNWYRCECTFTSSAGVTPTAAPTILSRITGTTGVTVCLYGAQVEVSQGATSYLPTLLTGITRQQDTLGMNNISTLGFDNMRGTAVMNFTPICGGSSFSRIWRLAGAQEAMGMAVNAGTAIYCTSRNSAGSVLSEAPRTVTLGTRSAIGMSLDADSATAAMTASLNGSGVEAARQALGPTATPTASGFLQNSTNTTYMGANVRRLRFFPFATPVASLNALTSTP